MASSCPTTVLSAAQFSSLGTQREARHPTSPKISFYGEAGSTYGQHRCAPRRHSRPDVVPGPGHYDSAYLLRTSTRRASVPHAFNPGTRVLTKKQVARLNKHRAKQRIWPSTCDGNVKPPGGPRVCAFGKTSANRSFFDPLASSLQRQINDKLSAKRIQRAAQEEATDDDLPPFK